MPSGPPVRNTPSEATPNTPLRYSNKDGSKFITVPRTHSVSDSPTSVAQFPTPPPAVPSTVNAAAMDYNHSKTSSHTTMAGGQGAAGLNKKKKKKKSKGQSQQKFEHDGLTGNSSSYHNHGNDDQVAHTNGPISRSAVTGSPIEYQQHIKASLAEFETSDMVEPDPDDIYFSDEEAPYDAHYNNNHLQFQQHPEAPQTTGKKKNKKKKKKNTNQEHLYSTGGGSQAGSVHGGSGGSGVGGGNIGATRKGKDRIWNTSTNEERERIKEFWLSLGEEDRRSLVKVEKEAVLKKMKEQQKHSCSCSVCGRKRTAIEEELEVLYDAYYEELEQYANQQQSKFVGGSSLPPHFSGRGHPPPLPLGPPSNRIEELEDDEDDYEDEYDEEEGEDEEVVEEEEPLPDNDPRPDFFTFGNSLTVQGGILTVADDLLKNDGKKFIEMMEQLAERRMQREEEASAVASGHLNMTMPLSSHGSHPNNHPQQSQEYEDEDEEEDDEEYEYEDEDEDDDEADTMTEEQRMEEGRRMFQIFAARMFEQRVLQAYREKVAQDRQRKLLEELEEETRLKEEREQRKAKEKERKKDRKRQQKQAKEEEKLKREAERAADEAAQKAVEEKKAEEMRKRKEEQRLKREAEKKAAEEERHRKEEEKKRRLQEEREREAEREKKRKEHQERERKKKEEATRKVKEEKEAREKEARERREREDREKRAREAAAVKKLAEEQERIRKEDEERRAAAAMAAAAARAQQPPVTMPNNNHHSHLPYISPHLSMATPAVPKQTFPGAPQVRPRQASQQGSVGSSPKTPQILPRIASSAAPSTPTMQQSAPGSIGPPNKTIMLSPSQQLPMLNNSPLHQPSHTTGPPPGVSLDNPFAGMSPIAMNGPGPFMPGIPQRQVLGNGVPMYPPQGQIPINGPQYRGFGPTNGIPIPIPAPGLRPLGQGGRGVFMSDMPGMAQTMGSPLPPPGVPLYAPGSPYTMPPSSIPNSHTHARQLSGSFEDPRAMQRPPPPAPIQRPQSTAPKGEDQDSTSKSIMDDLSNVLGSRALMGDDDGLDIPFEENMSPTRRGSNVFNARPRIGFAGCFDPIGNPNKDVFGTSPVVDWGPIPFNQSTGWANGAGWSDRDYAKRSINRRGETRLDSIRLLACRVCQQLSGPEITFLERGMVLKAMTTSAGPEVLPIQQKELDEIFEVEGDSQNGGGTFVIDRDQHGNTLIKFEPGDPKAFNPAPIAPGEIGSPSMMNAHPFAPPRGFSNTNHGVASFPSSGVF